MGGDVCGVPETEQEARGDCDCAGQTPSSEVASGVSNPSVFRSSQQLLGAEHSFPSPSFPLPRVFPSLHQSHPPIRIRM